jgi:flagellar FliL protein
VGGNNPLTIPNLTSSLKDASAFAARCAAVLPLAPSLGVSRTGQAMAAKKANKAQAEDADDEVDVDEGGEGGASEPKRKLPLKLIAIIAGGALVVLGGGGTTAYFIFGGAKETKAAAAPAKPTTFMDVPEVLVNLSNVGTDRTQYLKVKVVLELPDPTLQPQIQVAMPRVMDAFQTYLRELRPSDLDGSAGLYRLKEELTRRVNAAISPNRVNAVLFKEIVVQ